MYDPANMSWTDLSSPASGLPPSRRWGLGFAELGGLLYAFAGCTAPNANGYCAVHNGTHPRAYTCNDIKLIMLEVYNFILEVNNKGV